MSELVERLGDTEVYSTVNLTLADGSTVKGLACPVDYFPNERFRMEVNSHENPTLRVEIRSMYRKGSWEEPRARTCDVLRDESWNNAGVVTSVSETSL